MGDDKSCVVIKTNKDYDSYTYMRDSEFPLLKKAHDKKIPNVIKLVNFIDNTDWTKAKLVMEMGKGGDLNKVFELPGFQSDIQSTIGFHNFVLPVAGSLLETIAGLERADIVHRDIKPLNLVLMEKYDINTIAKVKLIDFGIAINRPYNDIYSGPLAYSPPYTPVE